MPAEPGQEILELGYMILSNVPNNELRSRSRSPLVPLRNLTRG